MNKRHLKIFAIFAVVFTVGYTWGILTVAGKVFPYDQLAAIKRHFAGAAATPPAHAPYWHEKTSFFDTFKATASVVMIGDSLTDGAEWREMFPAVNIANRGIDGDTTGGVLERMDGIVAVHAGKAFIMIGINDFADDSRPVDAVFANLRKIIAALRQNGAAVFVQSTLLCNEEKGAWKSCSAVNPKIRLLNQKLAALDPQEATYIDLNEKLADAGGLKSDLTIDDVHLNGTGYRLWRDTISPYLPAAQRRQP